MPDISFLSVREVADKFRVSDESIYRLVRDSRLKAIRIGGQWRIPESAVQELLDSGGTPEALPEQGPVKKQ